MCEAKLAKPPSFACIVRSMLEEQPFSMNQRPPSDLTRDAKKLARSRLAGHILCCDPHISDLCKELLHAAKGCRSGNWLLDENATLQQVALSLLERTWDPTVAADMTNTLHQVRRRIAEFARMNLEAELRFNVSTYLNPRDREVLLVLWGWTDEGSRTLQSVGDSFGISKKMVFDIKERFRKRYVRRKGFLPVLERVLRFVARRIPTTVEVIETELQASGLTLSHVPLERIVESAEQFGLPVPFVLAQCAAVRVAMEEKDVSVTSLILKHARREISRLGLANELQLSEQLAHSISTPIDPRLVKLVVSAVPGYESLGQGWFRSKDIQQTLLPLVVQKVLAVAPRIHVVEMCGAIAYYSLPTKLFPPREVVLRFCRSVADCEVEGEVIIARGRQDPWQIFNKGELAILDAFRAHGPLLSRTQLQDHCAERGVGRHSFRQYAIRTPIIARYARGLYRLRGTEIPN